MSTSEINALINLLEDSDREIYMVAESKLVEIGNDVLPHLTHANNNGISKRLRKRIEAVVKNIQIKSLVNKFQNWANAIKQDLLYGAYVVALFEYPELKFEHIINNIDRIYKDVQDAFCEDITPLEKIRLVNHIIFNVHGFKRSHTDYFAPENSYINHVLDSKEGNSVSLSIIYLTIIQRLKLPVYGVNLPRSFILAYKDIETRDILFYINPLNNGEILSRKQISNYLRQFNFETREQYFSTCSYNEIIDKLIFNLVDSYFRLGDNHKIMALEKMHRVFEER